MIEEIRFAPDSPLEGGGFEPSVPRLRWSSVQLAARDATDATPERRSFASTSSASDFRMPGAPFTWKKAGVELEIGFRDFEHLAAAPFRLLGNVGNLSGRSDFSPGANAKSRTKAGFPDLGGNFPDRLI
jgi:hypothetical protein